MYVSAHNIALAPKTLAFLPVRHLTDLLDATKDKKLKYAAFTGAGMYCVQHWSDDRRTADFYPILQESGYFERDCANFGNSLTIKSYITLSKQ
jgi:hypothetical protein